MLTALVRVVAGIVVNLAVLMGLAFVLGKTVPCIPQNKGYRFAFLFAVWVPMNFAMGYVNVQTLGYHKMNWTWAIIIALIFATLGTFFSSQSHNSNTP